MSELVGLALRLGFRVNPRVRVGLGRLGVGVLESGIGTRVRVTHRVGDMVGLGFELELVLGLG